MLQRFLGFANFSSLNKLVHCVNLNSVCRDQFSFFFKLVSICWFGHNFFFKCSIVVSNGLLFFLLNNMQKYRLHIFDLMVETGLAVCPTKKHLNANLWLKQKCHPWQVYRKNGDPSALFFWEHKSLQKTINVSHTSLTFLCWYWMILTIVSNAKNHFMGNKLHTTNTT